MEASPSVSIIAGGPERLTEIAPLWAQLREHHAGLSRLWRESILRSQFDARINQLREKCAPGGMLVLLAAAGGETVGYCVSTLTSDGKGEVDSIFVAELHRGRGIGRELFNRSVDWLALRGAKRVIVEVMAENAAARRLYESAGFRPRTVILERVAPTT